MKKLYFVVAALVVASMILTACGGSAAPSNTDHETTTPNGADHDGSDEVLTFTQPDTRVALFSPEDDEDQVMIYYLGNGKWKCESNYGDGSASCMSTVGSTTNFFWGSEKAATADSNTPGVLTPLDGWHHHSKG